MAEAQKKQRERDALMLKLKKQAEETKARKAHAKREKGWVGGSTTPREVLTPTTTSKKTVMIDTTDKQNPPRESFNFEELD